MYRAITLTSFVLLGVTVFGFENQGVFPSQLLALLGTTVAVSFMVSPVMVWLAIKDYVVSGKSRGATSVLLLAIIYLVIVIIAVYKIWPQLMGI
jgi:hypothetical protein